MTLEEIKNRLDGIRDGLQETIDDLKELEQEVEGTEFVLLAPPLEAYLIPGLEEWIDGAYQPGSIVDLYARPVNGYSILDDETSDADCVPA